LEGLCHIVLDDMGRREFDPSLQGAGAYKLTSTRRWKWQEPMKA